MVTYKKVGGIHFVAIGQLGFSVYISKKRKPLHHLLPLAVLPVAMLLGVSLGEYASYLL